MAHITSVRRFVFCVSASLLLLMFCTGIALAQTPVTNGYRDFTYNTGAPASPTGEKPESKLWWNDGFWWAGLYNSPANAFHIYRLDQSTQTWVDQGTQIDDRKSKADCLWDAANLKLYVASHISTTNGVSSTDTTKWGRLYRFTYNPVDKSYTLDSGFPVAITRGLSETLALAKDSTGTLWVTYVENNRVMVNHSTTSDATWGTPYILPVDSASTTLTSDDIASVIAFGGNKIGIIWSNENTKKDYFSIHNDGDPATAWSGPETALPTSNASGAWADDHINLKTDSTGRIFAAVKTSFTSSSSPLMVLLVRITDGTWHSYTYSTVSDNNTRPVVVLDEADDLLYMFATSSAAGGWILYKTSPMSNISFTTGAGAPIIKSSTETDINNVTTMKQSVSAATGLVVMASDANSRYYLHNFLTIGTGGTTITSFSPTSGSAGTQVDIQGSGFTGTTAVSFNGSSASFAVNSNTDLSATVPSGATTGKISVVTPNGTAVSADNFTVPTVPAIISFSPIAGNEGTTVTINGSGFTGATAVTFNTTNASNFNLLSDGQLTAVVPTGATTGPIGVSNGVGTGTSASNFTVTTGSSKTLTFTPIADSYTQSTQPTKNLGSSAHLFARLGTETTVTYNTYLRFSVGGLAGVPTSAVLRLFVNDGGNSTIVSAGDNSWTESGITWANAPAPGTFYGSSTPTVTGTWVSVPLPTSIFAAGNTDYSFVITSDRSDSIDYSSRQGLYPPQLVLTQ